MSLKPLMQEQVLPCSFGHFCSKNNRFQENSNARQSNVLKYNGFFIFFECAFDISCVCS